MENSLNSCLLVDKTVGLLHSAGLMKRIRCLFTNEFGEAKSPIKAPGTNCFVCLLCFVLLSFFLFWLNSYFGWKELGFLLWFKPETFDSASVRSTVASCPSEDTLFTLPLLIAVLFVCWYQVYFLSQFTLFIV